MAPESESFVPTQLIRLSDRSSSHLPHILTMQIVSFLRMLLLLLPSIYFWLPPPFVFSFCKPVCRPYGRSYYFSSTRHTVPPPLHFPILLISLLLLLAPPPWTLFVVSSRRFPPTVTRLTCICVCVSSCLVPPYRFRFAIIIIPPLRQLCHLFEKISFTSFSSASLSGHSHLKHQ